MKALGELGNKRHGIRSHTHGCSISPKLLIGDTPLAQGRCEGLHFRAAIRLERRESLVVAISYTRRLVPQVAASDCPVDRARSGKAAA